MRFADRFGLQPLLGRGLGKGGCGFVNALHVHQLRHFGRGRNDRLMEVLDVAVQVLQHRTPLQQQVPALGRQLTGLQHQAAQPAHAAEVVGQQRAAHHGDVHQVVSVDVGVQAQLRAVADLAEQLHRAGDAGRVGGKGFVGARGARRLQQRLVRGQQ